MACSRTAGSELNHDGTHAGAGGDEHARSATPQTAAEQPDPAGERPGAGVVAGAERRADQRLGGDRQRVEHQRGEEPQLQGDLVGAERGGAEPGARRRSRTGSWPGTPRPGQQVPAEHELLARSRAGRGRSDTRSPTSAAANSTAAERLRDDVGHRRADQAQPAGVDQQRAEHARRAGSGRARSTAGGGCPARRAASRCRRRRAAGRARRGPRSAASCAAASATSPAPPARVRASGAAADLHADRDQQADAEREPGRLDALGHRGGPVTRAEAAGRAARWCRTRPRCPARR